MSRIETCHVYALKTFDFIVKSICYYFEYFIQLKWQILIFKDSPPQPQASQNVLYYINSSYLLILQLFQLFTWGEYL